MGHVITKATRLQLPRTNRYTLCECRPRTKHDSTGADHFDEHGISPINVLSLLFVRVLPKMSITSRPRDVSSILLSKEVICPRVCTRCSTKRYGKPPIDITEKCTR